MRSLSLAAAAAALTACVTPPTVSITGAGTNLDLAARPKDCAVEFYRTKRPERLYDEVATLYYEGIALYGNGAAEAQDELREKACAIGADAVIVTLDFTRVGGGLMTGTAVSYRDERAAHRQRAQHAEAERRRAEADRRKADDELAARIGRTGVPTGWLPAKVRSAAIARAMPNRRASEGDVLRAGTGVWVSPTQENGYRLVWCAGVLVGWLESGELEVETPPRPALPAPPPDEAQRPSGSSGI